MIDLSSARQSCSTIRRTAIWSLTSVAPKSTSARSVTDHGTSTGAFVGSSLKSRLERTMQHSASVSTSPEVLHARWWPQGWWKIVDMRIGIVPIPVYVILVTLLVGFTYTGDIKGEISIMVAVLVI